MTEPKAQDSAAEVGTGALAHMTMRVYTVDQSGTVTSDSGTQRVDSLGVTLASSNRYPPCTCPSCRRKRAMR